MCHHSFLSSLQFTELFFLTTPYISRLFVRWCAVCYTYNSYIICIELTVFYWYFLLHSWGRCIGGKAVLCSLWCPFGILHLGRVTMQLRKLDNPSFSTPQKPDRHKPHVTLLSSLYAYPHSSIRDAPYIFVVVLGLVLCSSYPSWSTPNEVIEGSIETLFKFSR